MTPSPFELPLKASEAASLADIVFQLLENRRLQEDLRNRLASRAAGLALTSIRPYWGSLQQDPVHASSYYLAVDALAAPLPQPMLLRVALASAPASGLFPKAMLIGRMRPGGGREVVVNAVPFGPTDMAAIDVYATKVDRAFLPRPQASAPGLTVVSTEPEREIPLAFEGFRQAHRTTGLNVASFAAPPGLGERTVAAAAWSAIRAGWREGYNLEAEPMAAGEPDLDAAMRDRAMFTRVRVELSGEAGPAAPEILDWALEEFGRRFAVGDVAYQFEPVVIEAMCLRFGAGLAAAERLFDAMRRARVAAGYGRSFDFEVILPSADPRLTVFCLHWLKTRGRTASLVSPLLGSLPEAKELGSVARHFGAALSFDQDTLAALGHAVQWTGGRWNCRLSGAITAERVQATMAALRA
jgi:hypothetical protein